MSFGFSLTYKQTLIHPASPIGSVCMYRPDPAHSPCSSSDAAPFPHQSRYCVPGSLKLVCAIEAGLILALPKTPHLALHLVSPIQADFPFKLPALTYRACDQRRMAVFRRAGFACRYRDALAGAATRRWR